MTIYRRTSTLLICITISVVALTGCHYRSVEQDPATSSTIVKKTRIYPAMESFQLEDFHFGFALKLTELPTDIQQTPQQIDIDKTIHWNMGYTDSEQAEQLRSVLKSLKNGNISAISINGAKNKIFSLSGTTSQHGNLPPGLDITYSIETTTNLEMLSLKKETHYSRDYLKQQDFNKRDYIEKFVTTYGTPDYTHHRANSSGTFSHYWWGAGEEILLSGKGYDYLNASHWNGYQGKTFFVSIHKYSSGDIVVGEELNDNLKAFQNHLTE